FIEGTPPACPAPAGLSATNLTYSSADLGWTSDGTAFDIKWGAPGFNVETEGTLEEDFENGGTLSGLDSNTTYQFYVRNNCGVDGLSVWAGPFEFMTACESISIFPWTENFEGITAPALPDCWGYIDANNDGDFWKTWTEYGVGSSNAVGLYTDFNSGNNNDYLILPRFALTGNEQLKFSVRARSTTEPNDYRVVLSTTGNQATDFSVELFPLTVVSSITHTEIDPIDLSSYSGDVYIAIHVPNGGLDGYYIYFDNFTIEERPSCPPPIGLSVSNITSNSADLSWTSDGENFEISWGEGNFDPEDGTIVSCSNGGTLSGLDSSATHRFYVRQVCGDEVSSWAGPTAFTTLLAPATIPWMEAFATTAIPTGWSNTGFSFGTAPGITNAPGGVDGNVIYKNLYGFDTSGSFQTIQVGLVSEGDVLSFIYK